MPNEGNSDRGFASMDEDKQRAAASKGGSSVPDEKRSFSQDPQMAAEAGREGGQQSGGQNEGGRRDQDQDQRGQQQAQGGDERQQGGERGGSGNFANDPERASEAGRKGGQS
jgi:general stress protein YciG